MRLLVLAAAALVLCSSPPRAGAQESPPAREAAGAARRDSDRFLAGYLSAILEREFGRKGFRLTVREGVATLEAADFSREERKELETALRGVKGVKGVEWTGPRAPGKHPSTGGPTARARRPGEEAPKARADWGGREILPRDDLFSPLIADPRWPHFSAAYHNYFEDRELRSVGAVSFGESFALLRGPAPRSGRWELGVHAAVFGIFDLDAESKDLINADYWVGIPLAWRRGDLSALLRVYHQSSHLGDEFLLRTRTDRVNLSYEAVNLLLSWEGWGPFRLYGGTEYIFHKEPSDLEEWSVQYGVEFRSPKAFLGGTLRPVAGADFKNQEEAGWNLNASLRAGVQVEAPELVSQRLQFLFEYFSGRSPNGQFYEKTIEYYGLGVHLHF